MDEFIIVIYYVCIDTINLNYLFILDCYLKFKLD